LTLTSPSSPKLMTAKYDNEALAVASYFNHKLLAPKARLADWFPLYGDK
jgi:hypothetical protein